MPIVDVTNVTYRYGTRVVLRDLDLQVPQGALYALVGPNGCGKTTLLQLLMGLRRPAQGRVALFGTERSALSLRERSTIGYVAEGQRLPAWMRLKQLEEYLAPLYPTWDLSLAAHLRDRLTLDGRQRIETLSRGEYMKAALLCALAPRPKLLLMDEPFTGMDVVIKDEIIRSLLDTVADGECTVVMCSHDLSELELLADVVGFLGEGRMQISESVESLRERFKRVDVLLNELHKPTSHVASADWLAVEQSGPRLTFLAPNAHSDLTTDALANRFPNAVRIEVSDAPLREIFSALTKQSVNRSRTSKAA